jgi:hypothetical protein
MPKIKKNADTLNVITSLTLKLINGVKFKIMTINVTGKTEVNDSLILLINNFLTTYSTFLETL